MTPQVKQKERRDLALRPCLVNPLEENVHSLLSRGALDNWGL